MPSSVTPIQPIVFDPDYPFRVPLNIDDYPVDEELLKKVQKCHAGLKRVVLSVKKLKPKRGGGERMGDEAVGGFGLPHARLGVGSELPAERIAAIIVAVGAKYAVDLDKEFSFKITFYGVPGPGEDREKRAYSKLYWNGAEVGLPEGDEEGEDEEEDDEEGEEDEEGEDEEGEEGEDYENEDEEEDDDWAAGANPADPTAPPSMRHEPGVDAYQHLPPDEYAAAFRPTPQPGFPAPGEYPGQPPGRHPGQHIRGPNGSPMQPGHPMHQGAPMQPGQPPGMQYQHAFPPGAAPGYPHPQAMGQMTNPQMPMQDYRQEMHPAMAMFMHHLGGVFAETRASMREMRQDVRESRTEANNANQRVLNMANLSTSHYENMHRASQTGWNALHQGMSMQLNTLQNAMSWERKINELETKNEMDKRDAVAQQQGGGALETVLALAPLLMGGVGQVMHYVKGHEGDPPPLLPPGMAEAMMGGMPPGGMPPGMAPPGMVPPGMGQPGPPPPPPSPQAGPPPPPPPAAASPTAPQPGAAPTAPAGHNPQSGGLFGKPNGPFVGHPAAEVVDAPPSDVNTITVEAESPATPPAPGPQHPPARPADASAEQITADEVRARFAKAPLACMCDTLVKTTSAIDAAKFVEGDGDIWALLQEAGAGETDQIIQPVLGRLRDALDEPGRMGQLLGRVSTEHSHLLTDIRRSIASMSVTTAQPTATPTWVSPLESVQPVPGAAEPAAPSPGDWVMSQTPPDFNSGSPLPVMPNLPTAPPTAVAGTGDPVLDTRLEIEVVPSAPARPTGREPNRDKKRRSKKRNSSKAARKKNRGR